MEVNEEKLKSSLEKLKNCGKTIEKDVTIFLRLSTINETDMNKIFDFLVKNVLNLTYTNYINHLFADLMPLILTKAFPLHEKFDRIENYQHKCIVLAVLSKSSSICLRYSYKYFGKYPSPYTREDAPSAKKSTHEVTDLDVTKCCLNFLQADVSFFKNIWNWSEFVSTYYNKGCSMQRLICNTVLGILTNMTTSQISALNSTIPEEIQVSFGNQIEAHNVNDQLIEFTDIESNKLLQWNYPSELVTNIEGVLLPIYEEVNYKFFNQFSGAHERLVSVESTRTNLRSLAVGVSSGKAICLSGPVGSGKTTLVEYLARRTGHIAPKFQEYFHSKKSTNKKQIRNDKKSKRKIEPSSEEMFNNYIDEYEKLAPKNGFLRVQLGDQTDGKMLLGQYRCTDVPGEFVWQPGVLTNAVLHGYWLLLEDIDSATQDVSTILTNLLEYNYLNVPGFRDCLRIAPGFQLFVTLRSQKTGSARNTSYQLLEKYLHTINILPLTREELCQIICENYPKLSTIASRIVDVFLTFSSGCHSFDDTTSTDNPEGASIMLTGITNSGRLVSTRDLLKLCRRSDPSFVITSSECAYFVFQNAVDLFCSHLPQGPTKTDLIISIGSKLGIIESRCQSLADEYKPEVKITSDLIEVGRARVSRTASEDVSLFGEKRQSTDEIGFDYIQKKLKLEKNVALNKIQTIAKNAPTFSFTRLASCLLERISVGVGQNEPILLVGETGVGKTSSVQYLAHQTNHNLVVINMNNQSDVSDLVGGFKPVDQSYVIAPLRSEFEYLFKKTFNAAKNETFLSNISMCFNSGRFGVLVKLMLNIIDKAHVQIKKANADTQRAIKIIQRWDVLQSKLIKLNSQLKQSINISFAFITGSLVNCIKNGDWVLLDEINLASTETLECLSTILEPDGSIVLLEKGDFVPVKRHADFRVFACMNPNTDIGKKDLPIGIRNRFTEFFVDELTTENDLLILTNDYLSNTGIKKVKVLNIVKLYMKLRSLAQLQLSDGLGNRPVFSLRTLCRSLNICAKNLCGSIDRNLYESFCLSFLTQLDEDSHKFVLQLIQQTMLSNPKAILSQQIPKPEGEQIQFEGYWIQQGPKEVLACESYIITDTVRRNLKDLSRIISIGKLPILLQGPTSAGKTSLIDYIAKRSGNYCLRINNHEHTDLQEYIGTYTADVTGKLSFKEGVLVQAMRHGYWIILDELNLAPSDILEALNRVLDDNRELFIPETQTIVKAHPNFMLFATQNPPGLYGGRKTLSRAFKNRFIELHFSDIPKDELEIILEKRCLIPKSYAQKMVKTMAQLQMNRKSTAKGNFTLRDLFRWGNRYTYADKELLENKTYDWNQHLVDEGYLALSAKIRNNEEVEVIEEVLYKNFRKKINLYNIFSYHSETSLVTKKILESISSEDIHFKNIVWTEDMRRMAILTAKAIQFDEPVLLVGPTGCGKTTVCQILSGIAKTSLRILNCHMHTEGADFLGGLRPFRSDQSFDSDDKPKASAKKQLFEWANGPLILSMQEGGFFLADEISLAEDSVLERLNCILEPERTLLLAEKGGVNDNFITDTELINNSGEFVITATTGFQFLATMNPGGDFGKKELSPALRNRFTEIWCRPTENEEDLIKIAVHNIRMGIPENTQASEIATAIVKTGNFLKKNIDKFVVSIRDVLAWIEYVVKNVGAGNLKVSDALVYGLKTVFLDSLEMLPHENYNQIVALRNLINNFLLKEINMNIDKIFTISQMEATKGTSIASSDTNYGIHPFYVAANLSRSDFCKDFKFTAPTTFQNLFRLLSALSLDKSILLEGPPGVGKTSLIENLSAQIGYNIVRINLCEHTDLADLFGTDLPADDKSLDLTIEASNDASESMLGSFVWRDGPLLSALKSENTWILLDELNLAPQSVLEGLNAILDHRGEVFIPELNKTFKLRTQTRIFASQNPLRQGGGRKGLPQSFLNRFTKVYLRKLDTEDLLHVVHSKYGAFFENLGCYFSNCLTECGISCDNEKSFFESLDDEKNVNGTLERFGSKFDLSKRLVEFSETLERGISNLEFGSRGGPFEVNLRDILRWCDLLSNPKTGFVMTSVPQFTRCASNEYPSIVNDFLLILAEKMKLVYYQRMRCEEDQLFVMKAFAKIFHCDLEVIERNTKDISFYWTDDHVYLNDIVIEKDVTNQDAAHVIKKRSPLILSSQLKTLRDLSECVQMEMPVILCGPTDSGKTKCIDLLCTLSNQHCNVDTIDDSVTGSFQQIDLNRHLEEVSFILECNLRSVIRNIIEHHDGTEGFFLKTIIRLLSCWESYNVLLERSPSNITQNSSMSDELIQFKQRLSSLERICKELEPFSNDHGNFKPIKNAINTLKNIVQNSDSLNTGGHFEWVDSQIVKSLKCGQFICLEHVNMCSAAVLDRLNSVFEPNGTLLISEKGVTADDQLEVVGKHNNFRAFLTLDTKNGEISRAMRNRCIEICLTDKNYTEGDLISLIFDNGIKESYLIDLLLRIHHRLRNVSEFNSFGVSHVLKCAFLIAENKRLGYTDRKAVYLSALDVYVRSSNTDLLGFGLAFYRNKLEEELADELQNIPKYRNLNNGDNVVLHGDNLTTMTLIKKEVETFLVHLGSQIDTRKDDEQIPLKYLLYILYEICSAGDSQKRFVYLQQMLKSIGTSHELTSLQKLNDEFFAEIRKSVALKNDQYNWNLPWNSEIFPRIRDYKSSVLSVSDQLKLSALLISHITLEPITLQSTTKLNQINLITYSKAAYSNQILDSLNNNLVLNLHPFLESLDATLRTALTENASSLDSNEYANLICAFLWKRRLLEVGSENLFKHKKPNPKVLNSITLHYKWIKKHLVTLLDHIKELSGNSEFERTFKKINNFVTANEHPLNLPRKIYSKNMSNFLPYYSDDQLRIKEASQQYNKLCSIVNAESTYMDQHQIKKGFLSLFSDLNSGVKLMLTRHLKTLYDFKLNNYKDFGADELPIELQQQFENLKKEISNLELNDIASDNLDDLESGLMNLQEFQDDAQVDEVVKFKNVISTLPLREYFVVKALNNVGVKESERESINLEYISETPSLPFELVHFFKLLSSEHYHASENVWHSVLEYIQHEIKDCAQLDKLMSSLPKDFYKSYSSFHRQLLIATRNYTELSLAINNSICFEFDTIDGNVAPNLFTNGPLLTEIAMSMLINKGGQLKSSGLGELQTVRQSLAVTQELLWSNIGTIRNSLNFEKCGLEFHVPYAARLLREMDYVKEKCMQSQKKNISNLNDAFYSLTEKLKNSAEVASDYLPTLKSEFVSSSDRVKCNYISSMICALIGAIEINLSVYIPIVDPVEKSRLKTQYFNEDYNHLVNIERCYQSLKKSMNYNNLGAEMMNILEKKKKEIHLKIESISKMVAIRPTSCRYNDLMNTFESFVATCYHPNTLNKLIDRINYCYEFNVKKHSTEEVQLYIEALTDTIEQVQSCIEQSKRNQHIAMFSYEKYYEDFTQPIKFSISMMKHGWYGLMHALMMKKDSITVRKDGSYYEIDESESLTNVISNLIEFPNVHGILLQEDDEKSKNRINIYTVLDSLKNKEDVFVRLSKCKLLEIKNNISISSFITENLFAELDHTLDAFNKIWVQQEENRKKRLAEEESLYVNKTRCETENEEEVIAKEIDEIFPNYVDDDFGEFIQSDTLEQIIKIKYDKNVKRDIIDQEDFEIIAESFLYIMEQHSRSPHYEVSKNSSQPLQYADAYKERIEIFSRVLEKYKTCLTSKMDDTFFSGICVLVGILRNKYENSTDLEDKTPRPYNFYKDGNVPEIVNCLELLARLEQRVLAELEQWPDHAVLNDIVMIIARLRTISSSSPVVRFSTGFQLLRQKIDEWNQVAHRNNNLLELEVEVAGFIQRWTKLELQFWRECLGQTHTRVENKAFKYWFFIYNLLHEYLSGKDHQQVADWMPDIETDKLKSADVINVLKQFIEASSYGEFKLRMRLLKAFGNYLHYLKNVNEVKRIELISVVFNLHMYFDQFSKEIADTLTNMRTPIEKKLKEFVKIESYNKDLSYFSMRNNIAKVHRNLHKFLKEYENQLRTKIVQIFTIKGNQFSDIHFGNEKGKNLRFESKVMYYMVDVKNFLIPLKIKEKYCVVHENIPGSILLPKVGKLYNTSRNIVRSSILNSHFANRISSLDVLLADHIDTCEYFRNLEVDRSQEREKQITQAKHILQQKKKTLADFFKTLTKLGMSYRAGVMESTLTSELTDLKLKPFCIKAMVSEEKAKKLGQNILYLNDNLDSYFCKCVFKLKQLQGALLQPNAEVGMPNLERIKGFSVDLFCLVQNQRKSLSAFIENFHNLRHRIREVLDLSELANESNSLLEHNFVKSSERFNAIKNSFCRIKDVLKQFALLLKCVVNKTKDHMSVFKNEAFAMSQETALFKTVSEKTNNLLQFVDKSLIEAAKYENTRFLSHNICNSFENQIQTALCQLNDLIGCGSLSNGEYHIFVQPLCSLVEIIKKQHVICNDDEVLETNPTAVNIWLENLVHCILISMQKIYKKYSQDGDVPVAKTQSPTKQAIPEEEQILDQHLKTKVNAELLDDIGLMNISTIASKLSCILEAVKNNPDFVANKKSIHRISTVIPILEQYSALGEFFLIELLGVHKVSTKMLSIMLTVFIELTTKGFCVPPDLMQDEEGEAKNEDRGEGFGLEDGTGENDVSDKIENEDQLDGAQRPGDEKETNDKEDADCKEEKGIDMSEDFDSKLQELEKKEDESDDSDKSDDDEDPDKEMGETEDGAEKLDDQIWGSDEEKEGSDQEEDDMKEEDEGKGSKEDDEQHNDLQNQNDTEHKSDEQEGLDAANENDEREKKKKEKDIDHMEDPGVDEDQPNPYHNELEEPPEPENFDLDENMNLDNEDGDEKENNEENPFDIDTMKDQAEPTEEEEINEDETDEGKKEDEKMDDSSDSEEEPEIGDKRDENKPEEEATVEEEKKKEDETTQRPGEMDEEQKEEESSNEEKKEDLQDDFQESKDKKSKEENIQAMPKDEPQGSDDQVQVQQADQDNQQEEDMDVQDTGEDQKGVGQAENEESKTGHQGVTDAKDMKTNDADENEKQQQEKRKQGDTDEQRSMGDATQKQKKLKTVDKLNEDVNQDEPEKPSDADEEADEYQHVKEAKSSDKSTLDNATDEQSKKIVHEDEKNNEDDINADDEEGADEPMEVDEETENLENIETIDSEKVNENKPEKPSRNERKTDCSEVAEQVDVEGEVVPTFNIPRKAETTAHTMIDILQDTSMAKELSTLETMEMRKLFEQERLSTRLVQPQHEEFELWQSISNRMSSGARDLCEQLRLILEPTKCTRMKGDYRTGRRINMKKIIPYIASQFRKDKIWLRRTKPAQRDYKITIAIDDSKSMHHNNSKNLTLEAISLVSQALILLESGKLGIVSFGESPQIILNHSDQFDGPRLIKSLNFEQNQTRVAKMLDFVRIGNLEEGFSSSCGLFENLLLILSDGRNIFGEGEKVVKNAVKLARMQRIFIVYIIIDNPENKHSILDIQKPSADCMSVQAYLDTFPFPYYVIVKDLVQLPVVLSDAMRQWFELVNSEQ